MSVKYHEKNFRKEANNFESFDHNKRCKENFWKYCKDISEN